MHPDRSQHTNRGVTFYKAWYRRTTAFVRSAYTFRLTVDPSTIEFVIVEDHGQARCRIVFIAPDGTRHGITAACLPWTVAFCYDIVRGLTDAQTRIVFDNIEARFDPMIRHFVEPVADKTTCDYCRSGLAHDFEHHADSRFRHIYFGHN